MQQTELILYTLTRFESESFGSHAVDSGNQELDTGFMNSGTGIQDSNR